MLRRHGKELVALTLHAFAHELAVPAYGFGGDPGFLFRRLFVRAAQFHFAEDALALHLLLERAQGLVDIAVADSDRNDGLVSFFSTITPL